MRRRSHVATPVLVFARHAPSGWGARTLAVVAAVALLVGATVSSVWALSISQAYLFSDWSSPSTVTGAPFLLNGTSGFQLSLNGSGVATLAIAVSGPLPIQVANRLYYRSHMGTIDPHEVPTSALASRVNSEIALLDDAGLVNESLDAALNIDFTRNSTVTLGTSTADVVVPGLVIFEDAGLDPFSLRYCHNSACTVSDLLFNGFNSLTTSTILGSSGFGTDDYTPGIDQAFWFLFDQPATGGYFRIGDTQNFGGYRSERLEVDFVGVTTVAVPVPEPSTVLLIGSGLMGLPLLRRARSR